MKIRIDQDSKKYYWLLLAFITANLLLTLITPDRNEVVARYGISHTQLDLIQLGISLPLYAIWTLAFYGFAKTKQYADRIKSEPDGKGFSTLAKGLGLLALSMPVASLLSSGLNYLSADNLSIIPIGTSISRYVAIALSLAAYYLIYRGSKELAGVVKKNIEAPGYGWAAIYGAASAWYANLIVTRSVKRVPPTAETRATYYLPDWAIVVTVILPYVVSWYLGLLGVYYLSIYRNTVKGQIYKRSLNRLGSGVTLLIISSILVQFLSVFGSRLNNLSLAPLLGIIYVLLIFIAICYGLIANGAKLLRKIEEV